MNNQTLSYPVLVVEDDGKLPFQFKVVTGQSDFVDWFSVPNRNEFGTGRMYDSKGRVYLYSGHSSGSILEGWKHSLAENLLVPSIVYKLLSHSLYFGPNITGSLGMQDVAVFTENLISDLSKYLNEVQVEAVSKRILRDGISHDEVLNEVRSWVFQSASSRA